MYGQGKPQHFIQAAVRLSCKQCLGKRGIKRKSRKLRVSATDNSYKSTLAPHFVNDPVSSKASTREHQRFQTFQGLLPRLYRVSKAATNASSLGGYAQPKSSTSVIPSASNCSTTLVKLHLEISGSVDSYNKSISAVICARQRRVANRQ